MKLKRNMLSAAVLLVLTLFTLRGAVAATTDKWKNSPGADKYPNASSIILYDYIGSDFNADSSVAVTEHEAIKILKADALNKFGIVSRPFLSPDQSVKVDIARIVRPDGTIIEIDKEKQIKSEMSLADKIPLYKNLGIVSIDFTAAKEGDIIEFKLTTSNKKPPVPGQFWTISYTQDESPLVYTELAVKVAKAGAQIYWATPGNGDGKVKPEISTAKDGSKIYKWSFKNRDASENEPAAPPFRDRISSVLVTTFPNWEKMSEDLYKAMETSINPGPEVEKQTKEITANLTDNKDKVLAILKNLSAKKTMDLGFDADRFLIFTSDELLKAEVMGRGDLQLLFIAMLKAAGINAYPALIADQKYGDINSDIASPYQFGNVVAAVELNGKTCYIDAADPISPNFAPYAGKQGRKVLVLKPGGAKLAETPVTSSDDNLEEITVNAELSADGSLGARMQLVEKGAKRAFWDSIMGLLSQPGQRNAMFARLVQIISDDAQLLGSEITPSEKEDRIDIDLSFMSESYPTVSGKFWIVKLPTIPVGKKFPFIEKPVSERKYPVLMAALGKERKTVNLTLPSNVTVKSLPENVKLTNSVGSLSIDCKQEGNKIIYVYQLELTKMTIPVSEYKQLKDLYETAGKKADEIILLEKKEDSTKPVG
ncbi:MAG: DUF3857 domain-containing protein [Firmicutes bacterium]|nr:DUF3857 domain-containing protein [Bacillota bacterium]